MPIIEKFSTRRCPDCKEIIRGNFKELVKVRCPICPHEGTWLFFIDVTGTDAEKYFLKGISNETIRTTSK